jgi:hypothetical protein
MHESFMQTDFISADTDYTEMCIFTDTAQYKQRAPEQEQIFINI